VFVCSFSFYCYGYPRALHFPYTTLFRSCGSTFIISCATCTRNCFVSPARRSRWRCLPNSSPPAIGYCALTSCLSVILPTPCYWRSEEHTSELQSRENLVCRLLLEKKKKR